MERHRVVMKGRDMKLGLLTPTLALAMVMATTGAGWAQPQTKLVSGLDKATIQAIWCSALLFEESYYHETDSEEAIRYETLAFDLGADIDAMLMEDNGLRQVEVDEMWTVFDGAAYDLASSDEENFLAQLEMCETNYDDLL